VGIQKVQWKDLKNLDKKLDIVDFQERCDDLVDFWFSYNEKNGTKKTFDLEKEMPRRWFRTRYKDIKDYERFIDDVENVR
jgi:hypothetical protein